MWSFPAWSSKKFGRPTDAEGTPLDSMAAGARLSEPRVRSIFQRQHDSRLRESRSRPCRSDMPTPGHPIDRGFVTKQGEAPALASSRLHVASKPVRRCAGYAPLPSAVRNTGKLATALYPPPLTCWRLVTTGGATVCIGCWLLDCHSVIPRKMPTAIVPNTNTKTNPMKSGTNVGRRFVRTGIRTEVRRARTAHTTPKSARRQVPVPLPGFRPRSPAFP